MPVNEGNYYMTCVKNGDIDALGKLYKLYKTQVYRTALAITRDEGIAEDVLQETFVRVYKYADSFDHTQPFEPWLYRITVNLTYSLLNRTKRWIFFLHDAIERLKLLDNRNPEAMMESKEQRKNLQWAIACLPDSQRAVTVLYYLEDLSVSEIAYALDIPEGTVKSRLYHARRRLKKAITKRGHDLLSEVIYEVS